MADDLARAQIHHVFSNGGHQIAYALKLSAGAVDEQADGDCVIAAAQALDELLHFFKQPAVKLIDHLIAGHDALSRVDVFIEHRSQKCVANLRHAIGEFDQRRGQAKLPSAG